MSAVSLLFGVRSKLERLHKYHPITMVRSINQKVVQMVSLTVDNSGSYSDLYTLRRCLKQFNAIAGWVSIYWARDVNNLNKFNIYVTWLSIEAARMHPICKDPATIFGSITFLLMSNMFIHLHGSISHRYPTEVVMFYFDRHRLTHDDEILFEQQVSGTAVELLRRKDSSFGGSVQIISFANGWVSRFVPRNGQDARAYVVALSWSNLDALHDEKKDERSDFTNMFAPLKELASLGTETSLHTSLSLKERTERRCVVQ